MYEGPLPSGTRLVSSGAILNQLRLVLSNVWNATPHQLLRDYLAVFIEKIFSQLSKAITSTILQITMAGRPAHSWPEYFRNAYLRFIDWAGPPVVGMTMRPTVVPLATFVLNNLVAFAVGGLIRRLFRRTDATFLQIDSYFATGRPAKAHFSSEWRLLGIPQDTHARYSAVANVFSVLLLNPFELYTFAPLARIFGRTNWAMHWILTPVSLFGGTAIANMTSAFLSFQVISILLNILGLGFAGVTSLGYLGVLTALNAFVAYWKYRMASGVSLTLALDDDRSKLRLTTIRQIPTHGHRQVRLADEGVASDYRLQKWIMARLWMPSSSAYDRLAVRQALFRIQLGMLRSGQQLTQLIIDLPSINWPAFREALMLWQGKLLQILPPRRLGPPLLVWFTPFEQTRMSFGDEKTFASVRPLLLDIQTQLLQREIDHYVITTAPVPIYISHGTWEIELLLEPEGNVPINHDFLRDFLKVRELPGDDKSRHPRVFLRVSKWLGGETVLPIVLSFLANLCLVCRWFLHVPFPLQPVPAFLTHVPGGYLGLETPAIPNDHLEATLVDRLRMAAAI
jgi:hypothetical protein